MRSLLTMMILLALGAACGPAETETGAIEGCFDADGVRHKGTSNAACGSFGGTCDVCAPMCMYGPTGGPHGACEVPSGGAVFQLECVAQSCQISPSAEVLCCNGYACNDGAKGAMESACSQTPK